jgi:1-deoxy-D-xylulose-5-phosphate reductoisomerase
VYHPESVVHALVEYVDGSVKAQLAEPDMRLPIQYALLWDRAPSPAPRFDWTADRTLHFGAIDIRRYPCFAVVLETARAADLGAMIGLSAADEIAVERFLRGDIPFTDIAALLRRGADLGARAKQSAEPELEEVVAIDASVRASLAAPAVVV